MPDLTFDDIPAGKGGAPQAAAGNPGDLTFDDISVPGGTSGLRSAEELRGVDMLSHGKDIGQPKEVPGATVAPSPLSSGTADDLKTGAQAGAGYLGDIREKIKSYLPENARKTADTLFRHLAANPATSVLFGGPLAAIGGAPTTPELANATGHEQTTPSGPVGAAVQGAATMGTNPLSYLGGGGALAKVGSALGSGAGGGLGNYELGPVGGAIGGALGAGIGQGAGGVIASGLGKIGQEMFHRAADGAAPGPIPNVPGDVHMQDMPTQKALAGNVRGAYGATPISANPALKPPPMPTRAVQAPIAAPKTYTPLERYAIGQGVGHMASPLVGPWAGPIAGAAYMAAPGITKLPGAIAAGAAKLVPHLHIGEALRGGILGSQVGTP